MNILQQRKTPEEEWQDVSLHLSESYATLRLQEHRQRCPNYEFRIITTGEVNESE